ncbi:MAG TPA: PAS domain S-box protein [Pyrinomonadaceae bacterium]
MPNGISQESQDLLIRLRESEERYRALFDSIHEGFCVVEVLFDEGGKAVDYRFLKTNRVFEEQTGLVGAQGKWMRELAPAHEQYWFDIYGGVALTGEPVRFENHASALGRWYDVYAFRVGRPEERNVAILFEDITHHKRDEQG